MTSSFFEGFKLRVNRFEAVSKDILPQAGLPAGREHKVCTNGHEDLDYCMIALCGLSEITL